MNAPVAALTAKDRFNLRRQEVIDNYRRQPRPEALLASLRRVTDQTLREIIQHTPLPPGAALAAVGGYGRGELYPYSDIDVLILLQQPPSPADTEKLEALVAALWDLGLDLGHSVRTIADCQHEAANDITVETALMEARWLAGDKPLLQTLVRDGLLTQQNQRRWASYRVAEDSPQLGDDSPHLAGDSPQSSPQLAGDSPHLATNSPHLPPELLSLAEPARIKGKLPTAEMQALVVRLCNGRWLTSKDLASLLNRDAENLQGRILGVMVKKGLLELRFPDVPNRPDQAYRAVTGE